MRVRTTTKFKDLKEKKLRIPGTPSAEFECTEERYEEIKKFVEPIVDDGADVKEGADTIPHEVESVQEKSTQEEPAQEVEPEQVEEPAQEGKPKKATKGKKA